MRRLSLRRVTCQQLPLLFPISRQLCTAPEVRITQQLEWLGANVGPDTSPD
jgi:hypothetical protein